MTLTVLKGHGTENDFLVVPDLDGARPLDPVAVARLCDRHAGLGADGVLRVVRTRHCPEVADQAEHAEWFMDYRNADGSVAQMCGNGARVFARYLAAAGLVDSTRPFAIATRGGPRQIRMRADGQISVDMGQARQLPTRPTVTVRVRDRDQPVELAGQSWELPNPHVVVQLATHQELAALELGAAPVVEPAGATGQNVEFVVRDGPRELSLRVHERGAGETRSCGTGICAAVADVSSSASQDRDPAADRCEWTVRAPGGSCTVSRTESGGFQLTGPAELVARIEVLDGWLRK